MAPSEPEVLHGPWTTAFPQWGHPDAYEVRISKGEDGPQLDWRRHGKERWVTGEDCCLETSMAAAELASLSAENLALSATLAEQVDRADNAVAERDRLRALMARQRAALSVLKDACSQEANGGALGEECAVRIAELDAAAILSDPDGQQAAEWLKSQIAGELESRTLDLAEHVWYCEKCDRWQDERSPCEADARFNEAQPWKALAARQQEHIERLVQWGIDMGVETVPGVRASVEDPDGQRALAWFTSQREGSREEGRREGLRSAVESAALRRMPLYPKRRSP